MDISPAEFKKRMVKTRRAQILMGAAEVFAKKGYHKAKTKEIAKAAGLSEGTIYNYFNNKRELLFAMLDMVVVQSLKDVTQGAPPDDPKQFFTAIMQDRYQFLQRHGHLIAPIMAEIFTDTELREELYRQIIAPVTINIERYIQAHIDSGRFRQVDTAIVTRALAGAMMMNFAMKMTTLDIWDKDISPEPEMIFEQIGLLFLDGLSAKNEQEQKG